MRSRRALSTVVGAVFAIIALTSTVTYVSYSMGILDNYNQSVLTKNQQLSDANKEKFQISSVTIPANGRLNITVANTGSLPINFTKIWIQNTTTTTTDWSNSYTPTHNFVAPGGVLTKIGQNIPVYINPTYSYNVKLVTSRGNTQQFNVNSIGSTPLNIQLLALPTTVPSGFKTELVLIVTNNGTNTLTNITPQTPTQLSNHTASCSLVQNQASPSTYSTLSPGNTAIFKWDVNVSGSANGQSCTWTGQLQNGYTGNVASATATVTQVKLSSTTYAQNAGLLTLNYTSLQWVQPSPSGWNYGWSVPAGSNTGFSVQLTNNNSTGTLWLSQQSVMYFYAIGAGTSHPWYIVNTTSTSDSPTYFSCAYGDSCIKISPNQTATLYFAAQKAGGASGNSQQGFSNSASDYEGFLVIFGKFASKQNDVGTSYAQNIPFIGLITH